MLLGYLRKFGAMERRTRSGDFSVEGMGGGELFGRTMGIVGLGVIGKRVAAIAKGFGMRILAHDLAIDKALADCLGLEYTGLEELLTRSDVVSLHVPLTPETEGMIGPARMEIFKPGAILVNVARGELVDSAALLAGLESGRLGGALLDVVQGLSGVGVPGGIPVITDYAVPALIKREDVIISPHMAWYTGEATGRIFDLTMANILGFYNGEAVNIVN